jgi:hypothetical protein
MRYTHTHTYTRAVWKVSGLATVRGCYAEGGITAAHCRQSTNFSNGCHVCLCVFMYSFRLISFFRPSLLSLDNLISLFVSFFISFLLYLCLSSVLPSFLLCDVNKEWMCLFVKTICTVDTPSASSSLIFLLVAHQLTNSSLVMPYFYKRTPSMLLMRNGTPRTRLELGRQCSQVHKGF